MRENTMTPGQALDWMGGGNVSVALREKRCCLLVEEFDTRPAESRMK